MPLYRSHLIKWHMSKSESGADPGLTRWLDTPSISPDPFRFLPIYYGNKGVYAYGIIEFQHLQPINLMHINLSNLFYTFGTRMGIVTRVLLLTYLPVNVELS